MSEYDWDHGGVYYDKYGNKKWHVWSCDNPPYRTCKLTKSSLFVWYAQVRNRIVQERKQYQSLLDKTINQIDNFKELFQKSNKR